MLLYMDKQQRQDDKLAEYARQFAGRLKKALGSMTLPELSNVLAQSEIDLKPSRLGHYFSGRNYPDPPYLAVICQALGVSADWVLGLTEEELPIADLEEKLAVATGEGKINKLMRGMSKARQKQVLDFAEYLLSRETDNQRQAPRISRLPKNEIQRNIATLRAQLDSVEQKYGTDGRRDMEQAIWDELEGIDCED